MGRPKSGTGRQGSVRIIGGDWRGRRIVIPEIDGVRPSPDRIRETLFNWMQFSLPGRDCLDLFGGTGVLGLEAASRGAKSVVIVDSDPRIVSSIQAAVHELGALDRVSVACADALTWLGSVSQAFDVVFLDPPFRRELLATLCQRLETGQHLRSGGLVYVEAEREAEFAVPDGWQQLKTKIAGQVGYHLFKKSTTRSKTINIGTV